ncbi:MAG: ACP S-malonyltransferase [Candidatus Neomarinimicrobiota bacterium]|nr:ACP S-malonyltransferase [Candidatus Neomarinimicrobiota bacterium]
MDCCFIFSGQGSHRPGMGVNLYKNSSIAKSKIDLADSILDYKISQIMFSDDEETLKKTINAQVSIYIYSCILFDLAYDKNYLPIGVAGHSLGEFSALYANGTYSFEDGLEIVKIRAKAMHECETKNKGKMSAIIGLEKDIISDTCNNTDTQIANINSDQQIVISGTEKSVDEVSDKLKSLGAKRIIPLNVSGAFHSKLMSNAKEELKKIITEKTFHEPKCPIVSNYDGKKRSNIDDIKHTLIEQIDNPVLWNESVKELGEISSNIVEIGPKKVLSSLVKKINESFHISSFNSYNDIRERNHV